jgi:hypothetical protein
MRKIRLGSIPKRNENIRWREFGTEGILLDPGSGDYAEVNEVGITIWKHIDGQKTVEEIIEELLAHFDADDVALSEDTAEFMEELIGKGLLSVVP